MTMTPDEIRQRDLRFLTEIVAIPLRNRRREVVAYTLVDEADLPLVEGISMSLTGVGYVRGWVPGQGDMLMHRYLLGLGRGDLRQSDHINRNRLDNRRSNLRIVTSAQNNQNHPRRRGNAYPTPLGRWEAKVQLHKVSHYLGIYDTEAEARAVAAAWRRDHLPFSVEEGAC